MTLHDLCVVLIGYVVYCWYQNRYGEGLKIIATFNVMHHNLKLPCEVFQIELFPCLAHLFCLVYFIGLHLQILHVYMYLNIYLITRPLQIPKLF